MLCTFFLLLFKIASIVSVIRDYFLVKYIFSFLLDALVDALNIY